MILRVKIQKLEFGKSYEIEGYGGLGGTRFNFTRKKYTILQDYDRAGKLVWSEKLSKRELKKYLKSDVVRWVTEIQN